MLKFVILLSLVACTLGASIPEGMLPQLDGRIIGGTKTSISNFPWQVSIQRSGSHSCGGSIYNGKIIITAAHCVQFVSPSALSVRAGSDYLNSGGDLVGVDSYKFHENYSSKTMVNDIAVIRLISFLSTTTTVKRIGLALSAPKNGDPASVSGWGAVTPGSKVPSSQLRYVDVKIISQANCASRSYGYRSNIKDSMICASDIGKDSCQGDSGGPLVSNGALVGVVSWGKECGDAYYPGVYANVYYLRRWISEAASSI